MATGTTSALLNYMNGWNITYAREWVLVILKKCEKWDYIDKSSIWSLQFAANRSAKQGVSFTFHANIFVWYVIHSHQALKPQKNFNGTVQNGSNPPSLSGKDMSSWRHLGNAKLPHNSWHSGQKCDCRLRLGWWPHVHLDSSPNTHQVHLGSEMLLCTHVGFLRPDSWTRSPMTFTPARFNWLICHH